MKSRKDVHRDYYEAIIQLRPASPLLVDFVKSEIEKKGCVWISKVVKLKNGVDFYVSDQRFARGLGSKLKKRFKSGVLKMSRSLYGVDRMSSKKLYRVTVCFRLDEN